MIREPGFYWLRSREGGHGPNPTVAYWSGGDWQFIGSVFVIRENEDDDYGERVMERYDVLGPAIPPVNETRK